MARAAVGRPARSQYPDSGRAIGRARSNAPPVSRSTAVRRWAVNVRARALHGGREFFGGTGRQPGATGLLECRAERWVRRRSVADLEVREAVQDRARPGRARARPGEHGDRLARAAFEEQEPRLEAAE